MRQVQAHGARFKHMVPDSGTWMGSPHRAPCILLLLVFSFVTPRMRAIAWLAANQRVAEKIADSRRNQSNRRDGHCGKNILYQVQLL